MNKKRLVCSNWTSWCIV